MGGPPPGRRSWRLGRGPSTGIPGPSAAPPLGPGACKNGARPLTSADSAGPEAGGRDIERALALLVDDQRQALLLVTLEGLSYREVAEVQGVPIGTVMSRLARARAQVKAYLDGERPALRRVK